MKRFTDSFNVHAKSLIAAADQQDFENLQNTLSGLETGQQSRHGLSKDERDPITGKKRKTISEQIQETLEWLLLNDEQYKITYEKLHASLISAEETTEATLQNFSHLLKHAEHVLEGMKDRAAKLPNGTIILRDKEGKLRTEDGDIISDDIAATVIWSGNEPSYESFKNQQQQVFDLETSVNELRKIETELGSIRGQATDNEKPVSVETLEGFTKRTDDIKTRVEEIQKNVSERNLEITSTRVDLDEVSKLNINEQTMKVEKPKM